VILHGVLHHFLIKFRQVYQQVIDNQQKNSLNTKSDNSSDIKVDLVEQDIPKLSYFNSSDSHDTNVKGKHANLFKKKKHDPDLWMKDKS
jgi:hypothetical protein